MASIAFRNARLIDSISDRDARTLRLFKSCGITPGALLRVKKKAKLESYSVRVGQSSRALDLSREIASEIRILPAPK